MKSLKQKYDLKDMKIQKLKKNVQEATLLTGEESSKHMLATQFIKTMTEQVLLFTLYSNTIIHYILIKIIFIHVPGSIKTFLPSRGRKF